MSDSNQTMRIIKAMFVKRSDKRKKPVNPLFYALTAMLIAVTTVFTLIVRIPISVTGGYYNFSDVAVFFSGFTFGPLVGGVAGGVGAAIADLLSGFASFAPISLLAHGLQGVLAGLIGRMGPSLALALANIAGNINHKPGTFRLALSRTIKFLAVQSTSLALAIGWLAGTIAMVGIYLVGEGLFIGWPAAFAEMPWNLLQNLVGGFIGISLFYAVRRAYPAILQFGSRKPQNRSGN